MRRATVLLAQLSHRAGAPLESAVTAGCAATTTASSSSQLQQAAGFAAGQPPAITPNPLQQIVPPIIKGFGAAVGGLKSGVSAVSEGLADGPATRSAIAYFADKVLLSGTFLPPDSFDLPKWASWLADKGYDNKQGWNTLVDAVKSRVSALSPSEVEALVPALHAVGRYDRDLYNQFADIVKSRFTEFETPGLCKLLPVFAAHEHFDLQLWDDVADSITYCNHYLAASNAELTDIADLFAAYAKYEVDRGDLFVALARNIHEDKINELDDEQLKKVVGSLLKSFKDLAFYPDCTEALLVAARFKPHIFGPAENSIMAEVEAEMRSHAPNGALPWLDGGFKDPAHFHGSPFGDYQLWVMRDELIPQYYRPSDISPRPASMTREPPAPPTEAASASA